VILESLGSIMTCTHYIFNPKHCIFSRKYLLNLTLKPKTQPPNPDPNPNSLYSISYLIRVQLPKKITRSAHSKRNMLFSCSRIVCMYCRRVSLSDCRGRKREGEGERGREGERERGREGERERGREGVQHDMIQHDCTSISNLLVSLNAAGGPLT
jgi:hypothetical protein